MTNVIVLAGVVLLIVVVGIWYAGSSTGGSRTNSCRNNLRNVALSIYRFEHRNNQLPGFVQGTSTPAAPGNTRSAFTMIMPELERMDFEVPGDDLAVAPFMDVFVCPAADLSKEGPELSFVLNTGLPDDPRVFPRDWPQNGVFLDLRPAADGTPAPINSSMQLTSGDGAANTLMLLENLQAGWWTSTMETEVGCVWHPKYRRDSLAQMNSEPPDDAPSDPYRLVRPSSNHWGSVNVAFCDSHVRTLSDEIDYLVYAALMTSNGQRAALPGRQDGVPDEFRNYVLQEGDF